MPTIDVISIDVQLNRLMYIHISLSQNLMLVVKLMLLIYSMVIKSREVMYMTRFIAYHFLNQLLHNSPRKIIINISSFLFIRFILLFWALSYCCNFAISSSITLTQYISREQLQPSICAASLSCFWCLPFENALVSDF